jgi:hypothetical protein
MPISKQDQQSLDQIFSDYSDKYKGRKEDYFAGLYLVKKFKAEFSEIARQIAFGNNDYGIDAYYVDRESKNLYLYQFKWSENHNLFKDSLDRLAKYGMERIFGNPMGDPEQNELLRNLKGDLNEQRFLIQRVLIHYVFKGDLNAADKNEGLLDRRENLENKKYLVQEFFGNPNMDLQVDFMSDVRPPPRPSVPDFFKIGFTNPTSIGTSDQSKVMHIGFVPLMDLYRISRSLGATFLDRNIRFGLSPDNPPNKKIREALTDIVIKNRMSPDLFPFNHNGITLAAEQVTFENGYAVARVPRLLNGAQTITSVHKFIEENEGHPQLKDNAGVLEAIKVLAKVVVDDPFSDFITNVTICNNRQNPVFPWTLRANDRIQCDLAGKFREEVHILYSRQENAIQSRSQEELDELGIEDTRDIRIRPLARTFLAVQGEIVRMRQLPSVFENQKLYGETFREAYLKSDARKIILSYKVHLMIRSAMKRLEERAGENIRYAITKATDLVWALLIQGMLNDPDLQMLLDTYGTSLKKEAEFREYLMNMASSRLLPVLRKLLAEDENRKKLAAEKYEFMRSGAVFKKCMDIAHSQYSWVKKSF